MSAMRVQVIIKCSNGKSGGWLEPALLDKPTLTRAANAAAVLEASVVKAGDLSFDEGAEIKLLCDGAEVFSGRVFTKSRTRPEIINIRAYDELRYLQNRDCCSFTNATPGNMLRQIAGVLDLPLGDVADCGYRFTAKVYDNRRYIDMLADVLSDVLRAKSKHYFVLAEKGKLCLRDCREMMVDCVMALPNFSGYSYLTTLDEGYANRVKVIYEDKRKGLRREYPAENRTDIKRFGVLQYVSKNASANRQTRALADSLLKEMNRRGERLSVRGAPGDLRVRGGAMVRVNLNLGDRIVNDWALVQSARHTFLGGHCLMDLDLELI